MVCPKKKQLSRLCFPKEGEAGGNAVDGEGRKGQFMFREKGGKRPGEIDEETPSLAARKCA